MNAFPTRNPNNDRRVGTVFMAAFICLLSCSCASEVDVLKPTGEQTTITLSDSTQHDVELLAVSDSALYVVEGETIGLARLSDIRRVYVQGYLIPRSDRALGAIPIVLFQGVVACLAFAEEIEGLGIGIMATVPIILTLTAFATGAGEPDVSFSSPFDESRLRKLRLYSRYPQGLTDGQWAGLLAFHHQTTFAPLVPR
ncbi:MAG: hypothetical protein NTX17_08445 [Candidatus Eisenbacteria bacterium]|nr:hypothetical protein [Candidatus Eisenbacteria bacterium]